MPTSEHPASPESNAATSAETLARVASAAEHAPEASLEDHFFAVGESGTFHEQADPTSVGRLHRGHGARWWIATGGIAAVAVGGLALIASLFGSKPPQPPAVVTAPPPPPPVQVAPPAPPPPVEQPPPAAEAAPLTETPAASEAPTATTEAPTASVETPTPPPAPSPAAEAAPVAPAAPPLPQAKLEAPPAPATAVKEPAPAPPSSPPLVATTSPSEDATARCRRAASRGRYREVLDVCPQVFESDPRSADLALALARASLERARPKQAIEWADRAIAIDAKMADAYVVKGGGEQLVGRPAAAREAYRRYLQLAPNGRFAGELKTILKSL